MPSTSGNKEIKATTKKVSAMISNRFCFAMMAVRMDRKESMQARIRNSMITDKNSSKGLFSILLVT